MTLCENGYILESLTPTIKDVDDHDVVSYEIQDIVLRCFHFSSVKSKILVWDSLETSPPFFFFHLNMQYPVRDSGRTGIK